MIPGSKNILRKGLMDPEKIILPPLHIKLGLMKQFVKALDGNCFNYLGNKFPALSQAKVKEGIFVGPQIRALTKDRIFQESMTPAWISFKEVIDKSLGCKMSLRLNFIFSHLDQFPENLGAVSEEQGEWFHQGIKEMERWYQG
jgi:hypothetical protein